MKRPVDIEDLLRWAYRDELPKVEADQSVEGIGPQSGSMWGGVSQMGEEMAAAVHDGRPNVYGLLPSHNPFEQPINPDALIIGEAVNALDYVGFTLPADWSPFADMPGLGADAEWLTDAARQRLVQDSGFVRVEARRLVIRFAILGDRREWECEPIRRGWLSYANGAPRWFRRVLVDDGFGGAVEIEVDGYNKRGKRPFTDAFRKPVFDPSPNTVAEARAEYQVWHAAMAYLAARLDGCLSDFAVSGPARPWAPWEGGGMPERRILPMLVKGA